MIVWQCGFLCFASIEPQCQHGDLPRVQCGNPARVGTIWHDVILAYNFIAPYYLSDMTRHGVAWYHSFFYNNNNKAKQTKQNENQRFISATTTHGGGSDRRTRPVAFQVLAYPSVRVPRARDKRTSWSTGTRGHQLVLLGATGTTTDFKDFKDLKDF